MLLCCTLAVSCTSTESNKETAAIPGEVISVEKGKQLFAICATCHGTNAQGIDSLSAPRLTGLQDWYLERQLHHFKTGVRGGDVSDLRANQMAAMAKTLTDTLAVRQVVAYISSLTNENSFTIPEGNVENGKKYYSMVCGSCHGPQALGNVAFNAPSLVNHSYSYLFKQFNDFKHSKRGQHELDTYGSQMQMMSNSIPDSSSINDVIVYIMTLNAK